MIEEGYEALNYKKNSEIFSQLKLLDELRASLLRKIERKQQKVEGKLSLIDRTKHAVFQKIDNFFNLIIQIAEQRKEKLKREYLVIEEKERRSFADSSEKIKQDSGDLQQISQAFTYFYQTFDDAEDFNKNTENMYFYQASYQQLQKQIERKANFYKLKKFQPSDFKCIETDLAAVQNMGKIMDNSLADAPLLLFDTQKFAAFEYRAKGSDFRELGLTDTENFAERIPKDFKSIYVGGPDQSFLLVGGYDIRRSATSNAAYLYQKGKLKEVLEMYLPRQFFGICSNLMTELANPSLEHLVNDSTADQQQPQQKPNDVQIFVVGGFNDNQGCLKQVESYSMVQKQWRQHSAMNVERINPGCCTFEKQYVYVFGGRSADARADFYDSIERLNVDLNLWSFIKIKLPAKLCNLYAFAVKKDFIIVLGGLSRIQIDTRSGEVIDENTTKPVKMKYIKLEQKVDSNVYMYSLSKQKWFPLRPLSKQMKVCNVIPTGDCRFNCFLLPPRLNTQTDGKKPQQAVYPTNIVYDLKIVCPRLDRYWHFDHVQKAKTRQMSKESNSVTFLKTLSKAGGIGDGQLSLLAVEGGEALIQNEEAREIPLNSKSFHQERRKSNFRPEDFGQELGVIINGGKPETLDTITGDSLHSATEFDKAVESGEVDYMRARQERELQSKSRLTKKMANFARVSISLGKNKTVAEVLNIADGPFQQQQPSGEDAAQLFDYQQDPNTFGTSLNELVESQCAAATNHQHKTNNYVIGDDQSASSDSENDLVSAFK